MSVNQLSPVGHENVRELDGGGGRGAPAEHLLLPAPEDAARRAAHKEPRVQYAFFDGAHASGSVRQREVPARDTHEHLELRVEVRVGVIGRGAIDRSLCARPTCCRLWRARRGAGWAVCASCLRRCAAARRAGRRNGVLGNRNSDQIRNDLIYSTVTNSRAPDERDETGTYGTVQSVRVT